MCFYTISKAVRLHLKRLSRKSYAKHFKSGGLNMDKRQLIALIDLMSGLTETEIKSLMDLSIEDIDRKYRLVLNEKNDEMRCEE